MIKNVLLDLDDTILDFKMSERVALTKALTELGVTVTDEIVSKYSAFNISQWKRLELGEITREEVKINRYKLLFDELGLSLSPELTTQLYEKYLAQKHFFIEGAEEMLKDISKSYDLYLVSNGTKKVQQGRLKSARIAPMFKSIFVSEDVGNEKPIIDFFNYVFNTIPNFDKKQTVIIGDSLSSDIKGGINAGIKTIWYNPHNTPNTSSLTPDYEISSLSQISNILQNIK